MLPNRSQPTFLIWRKSTVMVIAHSCGCEGQKSVESWVCGWCSGSISPGTLLAVQWLRLHAFPAGSAGSIPGQGIKIHMPHSKAKTKKRLSVPFFSLGPERTIRTLGLEETDLELPVTGGGVWGEATQASHGGLDLVAPPGPRMIAEQCSSLHRCSLGWKFRWEGILGQPHWQMLHSLSLGELW